MKKFLLILTAALIPIASYADCSQNFCTTRIDRLYIKTETSKLYVGTTHNELNLSCTPVSNVYLTLDTSSQNFNAVYSALLSSFMADREVGIRVYGGSNGCEIDYITIDR